MRPHLCQSRKKTLTFLSYFCFILFSFQDQGFKYSAILFSFFSCPLLPPGPPLRPFPPNYMKQSTACLPSTEHVCVSDDWNRMAKWPPLNSRASLTLMFCYFILSFTFFLLLHSRNRWQVATTAEWWRRKKRQVRETPKAIPQTPLLSISFGYVS